MRGLHMSATLATRSSRAETLAAAAGRPPAAAVRLPLRPHATRRRRESVLPRVTCPAPCYARPGSRPVGPVTPTSGRHPLPAPADVRGDAAQLGRERRLARRGLRRRATACTRRGSGGCCAGWGTTQVVRARRRLRALDARSACRSTAVAAAAAPGDFVGTSAAADLAVDARRRARRRPRIRAGASARRARAGALPRRGRADRPRSPGTCPGARQPSAHRALAADGRLLDADATARALRAAAWARAAPDAGRSRCAAPA